MRNGLLNFIYRRHNVLSPRIERENVEDLTRVQTFLAEPNVGFLSARGVPGHLVAVTD